MHVFIVPKLFYSLWRRQFFKCMDLILVVPPLLSCWPESMHEPLMIGFCFPFIKHRPWCIRDTPKLCAVVREVQKMWKEEKVDGRDYLRKFLLEVRKLPFLSEYVVRSLLYFQSGDGLPCGDET